MAQYDEEVVLKITTNYATAVNEIVKLTNELGKLKADMEGVRQAQKDGLISSDEANKRLEALNAEYRRLNASVKSYRSEIDANLKAEEANAGSLKEMRAQLKNLLKEYDELSQVDREAIGGVGEEKLLEIRRLQEELRNAEEASGRFQRSVGSYEDAIKRALSGTVPLKTALKDLKTDIQQLSIQYKSMGNEIDSQRAKLQQLGATVGTDSQEYQEQAKILSDLEQKYTETGDAINKMSLAAGEISDTIGDTNTSIANFGKDNANMKAVAEGMGVLANSYQVAQAGMAAFGIQSEAMIEIWAKMQVIQQGVAALNQILISLEKESVLRQQLHIVVNKLLGKTIQQTAAAKTEDAAASAAAAAGDTALAAGETAATAAAGGLVTALKAVGAAIKSIPIIGWIAGAVALLGGLTLLVARHVKLEKENNKTLSEREQIQKNINDLEVEANKNAEESIVKLRAQITYLNSLEKGSKEWNTALGEVAKTLGVTKTELGENAEKLEEYAQAWITLQIIQAKSDLFIEQAAKNQKNLLNYEEQIQEILSQENKNDKEKTEELKKQYGFTEKIAQTLVKTYKESDKRKNGLFSWAYTDAAQNQSAEAYIKALQEGRKYIEDSSVMIEEQLTEAYTEASEITSKYFKNTANTASTTATTTAKNITKTAKELSEELENLMVEGMADGLEKNIKQVEVAAARYIEKMKEARDKDAENKEKYDAIILQYEKNTQDKIRKMRAEGYQTILASAEKLTESYNQLWASYAPNSFYNFVNDLAATATKVSNEVNRINKEIRDLENQVDQYKKTQGAESIFAADQEALSKKLQEQLKDLKEPITVPVKPELVLDDDAVITRWRKIIEKLSGVVSADNAKELADAWEKELKGISRQLVNGTNVLDIKGTIDSYLGGIAGTTAESTEKVRNALREAFNAILNDNGGLAELQSKLNQYAEDLIKYNKRVAENNKIQKENQAIQEQITAADQAAAQARQNEAKATENLKDAQEKLAEANKNYLSNLDESILKNRALNKSLREYAKTIQQVLLEQAKLGNIDIIPQDFSVYIDYQIDKLEEELAKAYRELEKLAPTAGDENNDAYKQQRELYNRIAGQLQMMKEARENVSKDMVTSSATGGFFDNDELIQNEINLKRVANQINTLQQVLEQGSDINGQISAAEEENNWLYKQRITLLTQISNAVTEQAKAQKEAELEEIDNQIALNNETIANLKQALALMGFTSEEEMQQLLNNLLKQEKTFSQQTEAVMKKTAASVAQSIGTIANSLLDLMNAIGEDNAEMSNFLEGVAYMQIGVNMAVGISEAIAAGSGVPFPGNLAAIAAGVAAVVSGIASAISTYKQYHKQVSSPKFAEGGYVSGEKGVDKIPAWLSDGEYVIKRKRVKELGVPFLDALNQGKSVVGRTHFAEGGYVNSNITNIVMNEEMRSMMIDAMNEIQPIVSVKEITNVQNKVRAKESVARK